MNAIDYRALARDMMKLCKKHGVKIRAYDEGLVILGPAKGRIGRDFPYCEFEFSPESATLGAEHDANRIEMKKE